MYEKHGAANAYLKLKWRMRNEMNDEISGDVYMSRNRLVAVKSVSAENVWPRHWSEEACAYGDDGETDALAR